MSENKERIVLDVAYQPQVRAKTDTKRIMLDVIIGLLPAVVVAVIQFGWYPLVVIASSIASCVSIPIAKAYLRATLNQPFFFKESKCFSQS